MKKVSPKKNSRNVSRGDNSPSSVGSGSRQVPSIDVSPIRKYTDNGQKMILEAMKSVIALPSGNSRDLYATHPAFVRIMDAQSNKILHIISDVLKMHEVKGNIVLRDHEEKIELLQEFNDAILERINSNMDEIAGIKKKHETVLLHSEIQLPAEPQHRLSGSWNNNVQSSPAPAIKATLITGTNIPRPQANFKVAVDNSALNPFIPKIKDKPNSLKPLAILPEYDEADNVIGYLHPYEYELDRFEPSKEMLSTVAPKQPLDLHSTPHDIIDKANQISSLVNELKQAKQIAIDLEHHSYRSYQGFTCLMQISTRNKDYIIDTLALREELQPLNEIFTDRKIIKVLHGASCDIEWLQRDLGLYIVNMFDTGEAAKVLEFSRIGLQFLLKHYCNIETDKAYQLADWRIRPLPSNFIEYARKDTHYLLYIYDCMRNELIKKGASFLLTVYNKSTFICKQRYVKAVISEDTIMNLYRRSKHVFDQRQMYAFREILYWRDKIARQEDESPGYVLPQHMALDIASKLPREMQGIIACCTPVPSLVRQHLHTIHQIILKAREIPLNKPISEPIDTRHKMQSTFDINNPLFCPHDNSHSGHLETNLPTLLGTQGTIGVCQQFVKSLMKDQPDASIFEKSKTRMMDEKGRLILNESVSDKARLTQFVKLYYQKEPNGQPLNSDVQLSYRDRKFNTPYERHVETCRNGYRNQPETVPEVKAEAADEAKSLDSSEIKLSDSTPIPETKPKKVKSIPLIQQKKLEQRELKRKLAETKTGDKILFNNYEPPKKKDKPEHTAKGQYPLLLKPLEEPKNDEDVEFDESLDNPDGIKRPTKQGKKGKNKKFKKKANVNRSSDFRQNSNKPIDFDYSKVDYSMFAGGSTPLVQRGKGRKGVINRFMLREEPSAGGSSNADVKKKLHPNSRIAKDLMKNQKMFNFSSNTHGKRK